MGNQNNQRPNYIHNKRTDQFLAMIINHKILCTGKNLLAIRHVDGRVSTLRSIISHGNLNIKCINASFSSTHTPQGVWYPVIPYKAVKTYSN